MRPPPPVLLVVFVAGFLIWSLAFVALYAAHSLICARAPGWPPAIAHGVMAAIWIGHLAAIAALAAWIVRRHPTERSDLRFLQRTSLMLALAAGIATVWTGLPILTTRACG